MQNSNALPERQSDEQNNGIATWLNDHNPTAHLQHTMLEGASLQNQNEISQ